MALFRRRRRTDSPELVDADGLVPVVVGFTAAQADSEVLATAAAGGVDLTHRLLLRHHLLLPGSAAVAEAATVLAEDGYRVLAAPGASESDPWPVRASRTQLLTGLSVSQERSRMAGLAQRLGGDVLGWDAVAGDEVVEPQGR